MQVEGYITVIQREKEGKQVAYQLIQMMDRKTHIDICITIHSDYNPTPTCTKVY